MPKTTISPSTRFNVPPEINEELLTISDTCLMVQSEHIKLGLNFGFGAVLTFLFMGLPAFLFAVIAPWMPPYGYRNGVEITTFIEKISGVSVEGLLAYLFFYVLLGGGFFIFMTYGFARLARTNASKRFSPITFNRQTQMVSAVFHKKETTIPWRQVKGTQYQRRTAGASLTIMHRDVIELEHLGMMEGDESLWEYICIFMHEGPGRLHIRPYMSDAWDHEPLYSRTFVQARHHHRIWPIVTNPGLHPLFSYTLWPFKVVLYIPFLLTEGFWRWMMLRASKKSINFPEYRFQHCNGQKVTGKTATRVARDREEINGINYLEIKRRLKVLPLQSSR